jgi:hypothetical protein
MQLSDVPMYSRVKSEGLEFNNKPVTEFNFYYILGDYAICETDSHKDFSLDINTEVEFVCSMKEYDLKQLNNKR